MSSTSTLVIYFLQMSRSIRTVWLAEELGIPYELKFSDRVKNKAPQEFKDACGNPMGKFPSIRDGDLVVWESGAITQYLCEKFDKEHRLIPTEGLERTQVNIWMHASEASFMLYGLAITFSRWNFPEDLKQSNPEYLEQMEVGMSVNVQKAFDWLSQTLAQSKSGWLVGDHLTAADIMTHFSAQFLLERQLGTKNRSWPKVNEWLKKCEATDSYQRAVKNSGYTLYPKTGF